MLAIACVLVALMAVALAPSFAMGQAANNEYNLTLPGANGGGSGDAGSGQSPGATGSSSDGGGTPIVLIALAALAAIGTGAAVWRLRDRSNAATKVGPGAPEAASETQ